MKERETVDVTVRKQISNGSVVFRTAVDAKIWAAFESYCERQSEVTMGTHIGDALEEWISV